MDTDEKRTEPRKNVLIAAIATDLNASYDVKCVIRDASTNGCRIVSERIGDLPDVIRIHPVGHDTQFVGKILWRDRKVAGVQLISEEDAQRLAKPAAVNALASKRGFSLFRWSRKGNANGAGGPGRTRQDYVSAVVHELRTPLTSLMGTLGLVTNGKLGDLPAKIMNVLRVALRNAGRLSILVNDLLDVSKIEAGKMEFSYKTIEIIELMDNVLASNRAFGDKYDVRLALKNDVDTACVRIDASRIEQVVTNLVSNAVKFSPKGASVVVAVQRNHGSIRISVIDRGPGIPPEMLNKVFEKFEQIKPADGQSKTGTGLGLSIAKAIVEAHGSRIQVKSKPDLGTVFWFDLNEVSSQGAAENDDTADDDASIFMIN